MRLRRHLIDCSPAWLTQPARTSSIRTGSKSCRASNARSVCASKAAGCTPESAPPPLPRPEAVRTTSTITAQRIVGPPTGREHSGAFVGTAVLGACVCDSLSLDGDGGDGRAGGSVDLDLRCDVHEAVAPVGRAVVGE